MNQISVSNMVIKQYAVSIKIYRTSKGQQISIDFKDMPGPLGKTGHINFECRGEKMIFYPAMENSGWRLRKNGKSVLRFSISNSKIIEKIKQYAGIYNNLHYDRENFCWYISGQESNPALVVSGLKLGNKVRSTRKKNEYKKRILEDLNLWIKDAMENDTLNEASELTDIFDRVSIL